MLRSLDFQSYNRSWLTGFIKENFPNYLFLDFYQHYKDNDNDKIVDNCIIYLDDESPESYALFFENLEYINKNIVLICKGKKNYDDLSTQGYKCFYCPYWHVIDDAVAVKKLQQLGKQMLPLVKNNYSYFCLNRREDFFREWTIKELERLDLIKFGYVTYHQFNYSYTNTEKVLVSGLQTSADLSHYVSTSIGFERHNHFIQGIGYSSNVANYYYINENILAPINISVETMLQPFFPTEKSFLAFFTKRIPIIFAENYRIQNLKLEGFDVFEDYVDHSYDTITDPCSRITHGIESNQNILSKFDRDLRFRTEANFDYLLNEWLDKKLTELVDSIRRLM